MIPDVNALKNYERIMIIFWKWRHPESGNRLEAEYDFKKVASDAKSIIIRFDPLKQRAINDAALDTQGLINYLNILYADILKNLSDKSQIQLFFHSSDGFSSSHVRDSLIHKFNDNMTEDGRQRLDTFLFQHGESDLYLGKKSHFGLLGLNGNWGELLLDNNTYVQAIHDNGEIKKAHFDFVWNLFHNNYKRKVYDTTQLFYRQFVPALETGLPQNRFELLKTEFIAQLKSSNKQDDDTFKKLITDLESLLTSIPADSDAMKSVLAEVRIAANKCIEKLPGNQVYV